MNIKKPFVEIVDLLNANKDAKVSSILEQVIAIAESKKKDSTVKYDDNGNPTEIFCWYHKEWESIELFGSKSSSHSGYNTMCKQGVNSWTKQQRDFKKSKGDLTDKLLSGEIKTEELEDILFSLEENKNTIYPRV